MKPADKIYWLLFCSIGFILIGCVGTQPSKSSQSLFLLDQRADCRTAWYMISEEMRKPTVSSAKSLCENHVAYLKILSTIVDRDFVPADADRIAEETYQYITDKCQDDQQKIEQTEHAYGLYYIRSQRSGRAIPHIKKAIDVSPPDSFNRLINQANLSSCYGDMGKFELRDLYLSLSIETGRNYFKTKPRHYTSEYFNQVNAYCSILTDRLNDLSWSAEAHSNLPEMHRIWDELKALFQQWYTISYQYRLYIGPIQSFALAGDTEFARTLLDEIKALNHKYPYKNQQEADSDFLMTEARIMEAQGRYQEAAMTLEEWAQQHETVTEKKLSGNDLRIVGLTFESCGNYPRAIYYLSRSLTEFEKLRSSFTLRSRGQVLGGMTITTYWGLLRSAGQQFLKTQMPADFEYALKIARMLRARQFGELLGIDDQLTSDFDIKSLKLHPDELLINIIITDSAVVIFEISSNHRDLKIIPIESNTFNELLRQARASLVDLRPDANPAAQLLKISDLIVAPFRDTLSKYKRIIAIPDGMLTGIPFSILSEFPDHYSPLILEHEIVLTPSLSYFIKQRNHKYQKPSDKILALADPIFDSIQTPKAYKDESISFYTRAVDAFGLFKPLPETRQEVANIVSMFKPEEALTLLGQDATKSNLMSQPLTDYRYLHFATHGILGNQIPGIEEPAIVLSAGAQKTFEEAFLKLSEVQQMKLNTELTVLSACDTGSGTYFTGEGVMGLSRGFLLAGSRSVVVSLWPVASHTTVSLMTNFYRYLKSGNSKAASLRMAQLDMINNPDYLKTALRGISIIQSDECGEHRLPPFYWAPFVLIGD